MARQPPKGHIWLALNPSKKFGRGFYLEIPIEVIQSNCLYPIKYLRYLAWSILHLEGTIFHAGACLQDDSEVVDRGKYLFHASDANGLFSFLAICCYLKHSYQTGSNVSWICKWLSNVHNTIQRKPPSVKISPRSYSSEIWSAYSLVNQDWAV